MFSYYVRPWTLTFHSCLCLMDLIYSCIYFKWKHTESLLLTPIWEAARNLEIFTQSQGQRLFPPSCKSFPTQRLLSEGLIIWFFRFYILVKSKKGSLPWCVQLVTLNWVSNGSTQWIIVAESWHLWWVLICIQIKCQERNQIIETVSIKHSC